MYKKLIAVVLSMVLVFCSVVPAFAFTSDASEKPAALSENPVLPYKTVLPTDIEFAGDADDSENIPADESAAEDGSDSEETDKPSGGKEDDEDEDDEDKEEEASPSAAEKAAIKYRNGLASYMRSKNPKMGKQWSRNLAQTFIDIGKKYNLDPKVLMALAQRESTFSSKATSPYGYKGMMQTSDWLAEHYGYKAKDVYDPKVSIDVAARYISNLKRSFGTYTLALSGFVYGGTAVKNGNFSKKPAWKIMNTRSEIQKYLEKHDFV